MAFSCRPSKLHCHRKFLQQEQISRELPGVCYSWEISQTKTSLVNKEHKAIQWQRNSTAGISDNHPSRCFHKGVGSTLQWNLNRRQWSKKGQGYHINVLELCDCKICNPDFHKKLSNLAIHVKMDNKVALPYFLKMGGYT